MTDYEEIGLGGGCHWCTEAVFQSLKGVSEVRQGYISSTGATNTFSEAVIVEYDPEVISIDKLVEIHLHTHHSTSNHSFREKYRSAIYFFYPEDEEKLQNILKSLQQEFEEKIITQILAFREFKPSRESIQDYYLKNPEKPFCQRYIDPKMEILRKRFSNLLALHS